VFETTGFAAICRHAMASLRDHFAHIAEKALFFFKFG